MVLLAMFAASPALTSSDFKRLFESQGVTSAQLDVRKFDRLSVTSQELQEALDALIVRHSDSAYFRPRFQKLKPLDCCFFLIDAAGEKGGPLPSKLSLPLARSVDGVVVYVEAVSISSSSGSASSSSSMICPLAAVQEALFNNSPAVNDVGSSPPSGASEEGLPKAEIKSAAARLKVNQLLKMTFRKKNDSSSPPQTWEGRVERRVDRTTTMINFGKHGVQRFPDANACIYLELILDFNTQPLLPMPSGDSLLPTPSALLPAPGGVAPFVVGAAADAPRWDGDGGASDISNATTAQQQGVPNARNPPSPPQSPPVSPVSTPPTSALSSGGGSGLPPPLALQTLVPPYQPPPPAYYNTPGLLMPPIRQQQPWGINNHWAPCQQQPPPAYGAPATAPTALLPQAQQQAAVGFRALPGLKEGTGSDGPAKEGIVDSDDGPPLAALQQRPTVAATSANSLGDNSKRSDDVASASVGTVDATTKQKGDGVAPSAKSGAAFGDKGNGTKEQLPLGPNHTNAMAEAPHRGGSTTTPAPQTPPESPPGRAENPPEHPKGLPKFVPVTKPHSSATPATQQPSVAVLKPAPAFKPMPMHDISLFMSRRRPGQTFKCTFVRLDDPLKVPKTWQGQLKSRGLAREAITIDWGDHGTTDTFPMIGTMITALFDAQQQQHSRTTTEEATAGATPEKTGNQQQPQKAPPLPRYDPNATTVTKQQQQKAPVPPTTVDSGSKKMQRDGGLSSTPSQPLLPVPRSRQAPQQTLASGATAAAASATSTAARAAATVAVDATSAAALPAKAVHHPSPQAKVVEHPPDSEEMVVCPFSSCSASAKSAAPARIPASHLLRHVMRFHASDSLAICPGARFHQPLRRVSAANGGEVKRPRSE